MTESAPVVAVDMLVRRPVDDKFPDAEYADR